MNPTLGGMTQEEYDFVEKKMAEFVDAEGLRPEMPIVRSYVSRGHAFDYIVSVNAALVDMAARDGRVPKDATEL